MTHLHFGVTRCCWWQCQSFSRSYTSKWKQRSPKTDKNTLKIWAASLTHAKIYVWMMIANLHASRRLADGSISELYWNERFSVSLGVVASSLHFHELVVFTMWQKHFDILMKAMKNICRCQIPRWKKKKITFSHHVYSNHSSYTYIPFHSSIPYSWKQNVSEGSYLIQSLQIALIFVTQ